MELTHWDRLNMLREAVPSGLRKQELISTFKCSSFYLFRIYIYVFFRMGTNYCFCCFILCFITLCLKKDKKILSTPWYNTFLFILGENGQWFLAIKEKLPSWRLRVTGCSDSYWKRQVFAKWISGGESGSPDCLASDVTIALNQSPLQPMALP